MTPSDRRPVMPSFQAIVLARSMAGSATRIPVTFRPAAMPSAAAYSSAAWMMALDGMQPTLRQVPPALFISTIIVSMPSCPARIAQT